MKSEGKVSQSTTFITYLSPDLLSCIVWFKITSKNTEYKTYCSCGTMPELSEAGVAGVMGVMGVSGVL